MSGQEKENFTDLSEYVDGMPEFTADDLKDTNSWVHSESQKHFMCMTPDEAHRASLLHPFTLREELERGSVPTDYGILTQRNPDSQSMLSSPPLSTMTRNITELPSTSSGVYERGVSIKTSNRVSTPIPVINSVMPLHTSSPGTSVSIIRLPRDHHATQDGRTQSITTTTDIIDTPISNLNAKPKRLNEKNRNTPLNKRIKKCDVPPAIKRKKGVCEPSRRKKSIPILDLESENEEVEIGRNTIETRVVPKEEDDVDIALERSKSSLMESVLRAQGVKRALECEIEELIEWLSKKPKKK